MSTLQKISLTQNQIHRYRWIERLIAIVAVLNLCLVLFDISYVHWRYFYFQEIPILTRVYDPLKGIEPHRETENYLNKVDQLELQVMQTGLQSPKVETLLEELHKLSNELIEDNPFAIANKTGTLEKIKNQIRDRVGINSSHQAFATFWSQPYLSEVGWQKEIDFFNVHARPLIQTNYYRAIGINGKYIDKFWQIDLPFIILFGIDFLARTFYIGRRNLKLSWLEAMLRRWYDIFLLLPFWRWLRIIPVTIRLYQASLVNFEPIRRQIKYDFVANFAEEMTEVVGIRLIDQAQESIQRGDVARWLLKPETRKPYININNTNEVQAIASRLLHISVYNVFPKIQADIEVMLQHSIKTILNQSPVYRQLQNLPGLNNFPSQLTEKLATDISQSAYSTFTTTLEDPVVVEMTNRLIQNFSKALEIELQKKDNLQEIETLLLDLLEEIKINYVKGIEEGGVEKILEEATQLRRIIR